jgi:hypothetical protein
MSRESGCEAFRRYCEEVYPVAGVGKSFGGIDRERSAVPRCAKRYAWRAAPKASELSERGYRAHPGIRYRERETVVGGLGLAQSDGCGGAPEVCGRGGLRRERRMVALLRAFKGSVVPYQAKVRAPEIARGSWM